jgi:hypothetical protein
LKDALEVPDHASQFPRERKKPGAFVVNFVANFVDAESELGFD